MKLFLSFFSHPLFIIGFFLVLSSSRATSVFQDDPTYNILPTGTAILESIPQGNDSSTIQGECITDIFANNFSNKDSSFTVPTQVAHANCNRTSNEFESVFAFTAIGNDGSPISWGNINWHLEKNPNYHGENNVAMFIQVWDAIHTPTIPNGKKIKSITLSLYNVAAILDDSSSLVWGLNMDPSGATVPPLAGQSLISILSEESTLVPIFVSNGFNGDLSTLPLDATVVAVVSINSVAELHNNGLITDALGDLTKPGGTVNHLSFPKDKKALSIISNDYAFAAILNDGSILAWGNSLCGGISPILPKGRKAVSIASTEKAFAAILDDRSLFCWGDYSKGGNTPTLLSDRKVVSIVSNYSAFAAILDNGSVITWGEGPSAITPKLPIGKKVISITANSSAFAAILDDKSVFCWGDSASGGDTPFLTLDQKVVSITGNFDAFAALLDDRSILSWGNQEDGGKSPILPSDTTVSSIISNNHAFTALLNNGSIISWGNKCAGGVTPTISFGKTVSSLITPFEKNLNFKNSTELPSIAIIWNPSPEEGQWQYAENGTDTWTDIPSMPYELDQEAFALKSDAKIRFVPTLGFSGTPRGLTARLINATKTVSNGERINVLTHGGLTPFSQGTISINTVVQ